MADLIRVWIATYGPDPNALDLDRRQNGYTLITPATPVIDPSEIDRWAANLPFSGNPTIQSPTGTAGGVALTFQEIDNGFGALLPAGQKKQTIVIDLPIGSIESPDVFPLRYSYQEIKLSAENVGEPIIFTYDYHNLIVLNFSGKQIRSYEKQIQTNTGGYADFEPIKRSPSNTIVFLTKEEELYKVVGKNLLLIASFNAVYAFGFDSDSNLYVFEERTGSENNCFWYKFDFPDYTSFMKKQIFVNGYANPGYTWAMDGWYQVKSDGGFYFGTSENPNAELRGDINQGILYRHNSEGQQDLSVLLPIAQGDFTSYHEVVTGMGEDEDGNIICLTHVEAVLTPLITCLFQIGTSDGSEIEVTVSSTATVVTVDISEAEWWYLDRLYLKQLASGNQIKVTKIEFYYSNSWEEQTNWNLGPNITWDGSGWVFAPEYSDDIGYISRSGEGIENIMEWRITYLITAISGEGP